MLERLRDRFERAPVARLIAAFVICLMLFRLRNWCFGGAKPPDGRWGYSPANVHEFLGLVGPAGRQLYAWTQVTLDLVFPFLYGLLLSGWIARTPPPRISRYAVWLPWLAALLDLGENGILAYLAWTWTADGPPSSVAALASKATRGKWVCLGLAILCVLPGSLRHLWQRRHRLAAWLPYAYLLRVPLLLAFVLVALPILAMGGGRNVLANLFVLTPGELFWVALAVVLAAAAVLVMARVVLLYGPDRCGVTSLGTQQAIPAWQPAGALLVAGWVIGFALVASIRGIPITGSPAGGAWGVAALDLLAAVAGALVAVAIVWLLETMRFRLADVPPKGLTDGVQSVPDLAIPGRFVQRWVHASTPPPSAQYFTRRLAEAMGGHNRAPGYVNPSTGDLQSGHVFALLVLAVLLVFYALGFFLDYPHRDRGSMVPALVYLLALLTLPSWVLGGAAFFLDRYRIPVLVVPATLLALAFVAPTDHFFDTLGSAPPALGRAEPADLVRRLDGCRLTAVAASGGGIRAAGWTARVLTGLHRDVPGFTPSLKLLSTVSGGSVGAMYFVGGFIGRDGPPAASLDRIVELSMRSSLNDVAWGLTYPDLWRTFTPFVLNTATDRAWALEQAWRRDWPARDETLRQWRNAAAEGQRPAVAFNATLVETGQRMVLGSFDTPASLQTRTFESIYGQDVSVVTAARLSATFTYVTPVARAREAQVKWHVADGGYQDNYGVATLVDWLDAALLAPAAAAPADALGPCGDRLRVALVRIGAGEAEPQAANRSWAFQVGAPLQVLLAIRTAGPRSRNNMELALLREAGLRPHLGLFCFDYANADSPLSWHLSDEQRRRITDAWQEPKIQGERQALQDFLTGRTTDSGCRG